VNRTALTSLVHAALGELDTADGTAHLAMLAHALIDPIDPRLASCSALFVVPVEGLHRVPFLGPVFIERFYSNILTKGASAAEAMRAAQLTVRDIPEFRHPSFWAPFVVYGR
jgi:hypothetical protein